MPLKLVFGSVEVSLAPSTRITIGRSPQADVQIKNDPLVSSCHCVVSSGVLTDASSTNGSVLNGVKITQQQPYTLKAGDVVMVGESKLMIEEGMPYATADETMHMVYTYEQGGGSTAANKQQQPQQHVSAGGVQSAGQQQQQHSAGHEEEGDDESNDELLRAFAINEALSSDEDEVDVSVSSPQPPSSSADVHSSLPLDERTHLQRVIRELEHRVSSAERQLAHQQKKANVLAHSKRYEQQVADMQYQMLYGDTIKDKEMVALKKELQQMSMAIPTQLGMPPSDMKDLFKQQVVSSEEYRELQATVSRLQEALQRAQANNAHEKQQQVNGSRKEETENLQQPVPTLPHSSIAASPLSSPVKCSSPSDSLASPSSSPTPTPGPPSTSSSSSSPSSLLSLCSLVSSLSARVDSVSAAHTAALHQLSQDVQAAITQWRDSSTTQHTHSNERNSESERQHRQHADAAIEDVQETLQRLDHTCQAVSSHVEQIRETMMRQLREQQEQQQQQIHTLSTQLSELLVASSAASTSSTPFVSSVPPSLFSLSLSSPLLLPSAAVFSFAVAVLVAALLHT